MKNDNPQAPLGRICNPPALSISICNATRYIHIHFFSYCYCNIKIPSWQDVSQVVLVIVHEGEVVPRLKRICNSLGWSISISRCNKQACCFHHRSLRSVKLYARLCSFAAKIVNIPITLQFCCFFNTFFMQPRAEPGSSREFGYFQRISKKTSPPHFFA